MRLKRFVWKPEAGVIRAALDLIVLDQVYPGTVALPHMEDDRQNTIQEAVWVAESRR